MNSPQPHLAPSGISLIDSSWGGLYRGGTYLLVGHVRAGRTRYALATVRAAVDAGESCLLISSRNQESLVKQASEVGLDLIDASSRKLVQLMNAPAPQELANLGDDGLARTLSDLAGLAKSHDSKRVVVDNFTPFVQFRSFENFATAFSTLSAQAAELNTTFVLGLGEPANPASHRLLDYVAGEATGTMRLGLTTTDEVNLAPGTAHHSEQPPSTETTEQATFTAIPLSEEDEQQSEEIAGPPVDLSFPGIESLPDLDTVVGPLPEPDLPPVGAPVAHTFDQPSGDSIWTDITPVSPSDAPHLQEPVDPFLNDPKSDVLSQGHYVDSRGELKAVPKTPEPPADLGDLASSIQQSAYPELFAPVEQSASPAAIFKAALTDAFANRDSAPFLVMALRVAPDSPVVGVFPSVADGVEKGAGALGRVLRDRDRLIALIPNAGSNAVQHVFAVLKDHLNAVIPEHAALTLQHVNAFNAPNGTPFNSADELFAYAFEN